MLAKNFNGVDALFLFCFVGLVLLSSWSRSGDFKRGVTLFAIGPQLIEIPATL